MDRLGERVALHKLGWRLSSAAPFIGIAVYQCTDQLQGSVKPFPLIYCEIDRTGGQSGSFRRRIEGFLPYRDEFYLFWEFGVVGCGDYPFRSLTRGAAWPVCLPDKVLKEFLACGMTISVILRDTGRCTHAVCCGRRRFEQGWDLESDYHSKERENVVLRRLERSSSDPS